MKTRIGIFALGIALTSAANAADLPTTKPAEAPPQANCFSSLWNWLNSSPADCPLSYAGFTLYATIDVGLGYSSNGAGFSPTYSNGVYSFVGKQSNGSKWLWTPNGINQSVVGINMREPIGCGLVTDRRVGSRIRPVFRPTGQRSALARAE